jgi:hypothetical protein
MKMRIVPLVIGLFLALVPGRLLACICTAERTEREAIDRAETVFAGRVLWVRATADGEYEATLLVSRWWKGRGLTATVRTSQSSCGAGFRVGRMYRVFTARHQGRLFTSPCLGPNPPAAPPPVALRAAAARGWGCAG